jgi:hypothetical protein
MVRSGDWKAAQARAAQKTLSDLIERHQHPRTALIAVHDPPAAPADAKRLLPLD